MKCQEVQSATFQTWDSATFQTWDSATFQTWDSATFQTWDSATFQTWDSATFQTWDSATFQTWDSATFQTWDMVKESRHQSCRTRLLIAEGSPLVDSQLRGIRRSEHFGFYADSGRRQQFTCRRCTDHVKEFQQLDLLCYFHGDFLRSI